MSTGRICPCIKDNKENIARQSVWQNAGEWNCQGAAFAKKLSWFKLNAAGLTSLKFNMWKELVLFSTWTFKMTKNPKLSLICVGYDLARGARRECLNSKPGSYLARIFGNSQWRPCHVTKLWDLSKVLEFISCSGMFLLNRSSRLCSFLKRVLASIFQIWTEQTLHFKSK